MPMHELIREQARAFICGELGHKKIPVRPLQIRDETREVFCRCFICNEEFWVQLPIEGYQRLKNDISKGKIK